MFTIENGIVYDSQTTQADASAKICIGNEVQYLTSETDTQTVYQWQKFNVDTGAYQDDTTNTTPIMGQTPVNGQVAIDKPAPPAPAPTLEELQANQLVIMSALADMYEKIADRTTTEADS